MLIDLLNISTSKVEQDNLAASLINAVLSDQVTNPLHGYAVLKSLQNATTRALEEAGAAAESFCVKSQLGTDGKNFAYDGEVFRRIEKRTYNYADNDDSGNFKNLALSKSKLEQQLKLVNADIRNLKSHIEQDHPRMLPTEIDVVLSYLGTEAEVRKTNA